jgi:signal transduction histidine kinase
LNLQAKFALYNAATKIAIILVIGSIILLSLDKISYKHLDNRLAKKRQKIIKNLSEREIDSLLHNQYSFTDYNILKEEFIILTAIPKTSKLSHYIAYITEKREIEGDIEIYRILSDEFEYHNKRYKLEIGESMTAMQAIKNTVRFYTLIVLALVLLITLITDYTFANFILKPFYKIVDQKLNKVNDPSLYPYNNIPTSTTDFQFLDNSINGLMRKISDMFKLEKQFIANVSHELLTPISVLNGRLENILAAENMPQEHEHKIIASLKTLNRLKTIINSLLLISKIENEQYSKKDMVSVSLELQDIYEDLEDRIIAKNLSFSNRTTIDFHFMGNQALIHILLVNMINNAIKYNKERGAIDISDKLEGSQYHLTIADTGRGMPPAALKNIFNRFERGDEKDENGFGLGLAIVNSIANFHQIKIEVNSEPDKGTTFNLVFPVQHF